MHDFLPNAERRPVYLDNNASTRVDPTVANAMLATLVENYGNPSSSHFAGAAARHAVSVARQNVRRLIGAESEHEIVFTSGGTEADNLALLSAAETQTGRDEIVTTSVEHAAILSPCTYLSRAKGMKVVLVPVDSKGRLDVAAYRRALGPRTAIASVMWANNETGTIFPVEELAALARDAGALFHTDAVQAVGRVSVRVATTGIDMLSLSAHKLHGPKGVGALYVRRGTKVRASTMGGRQERGRRAGTENVPGIVGLGVAAGLAADRMGEGWSRVGELRDRLECGLLERVEGAYVVGDREHRVPNTSNVAFEYVEGEALLAHLGRAGVAASSGSACASGAVEPSHVLRAMGASASLARGAIRFSLSWDNDERDVERVLDALPPIVRSLRDAPRHAGRSNRHPWSSPSSIGPAAGDAR